MGYKTDFGRASDWENGKFYVLLILISVNNANFTTSTSIEID